MTERTSSLDFAEASIERAWPAGFPLGLLLGPPAGFRGSLLGAQQLLRLLDLLGDARAGEVAAEGRGPDAVVGSELPERLSGGAAANHLGVGYQSAQAAVALHRGILPRFLAHH